MIIVIALSVIVVSFAFSDTVRLDVTLDGQNVTVSPIAVPFGKDIGSMSTEMENYTYDQMNNVDSNVTTLKEGLTKIAKNYGFKDITVNVNSQFGENTMPMEVVVDGVSMVPTLKDGENVIIEKTKSPKIGDIIVVKDPEEVLLIKRLGNISGDQIFLSSDNNDTVVMNVNGVPVEMIAIEKWTNASNIVGVAKIFNV
ncbi:S24/S26 family peptidase [Methanobrevibacter sp. TMH8]|uniref:S24/S26 family peptidase n=1 Tax=Methanobrevibacter sp. TMH8 TaxID=2848611 RepID=UPI001CCF0119|nr:S24/S26 family peptidase [Methanobrevibacter sp. TMH8]MBZ9570240.1 S24/S26 family peptidase [Methanobrevibacter sp. TMH8]